MPYNKMKTIQVVAAIIRDASGRYLATQRGYGEWKDWWEFPGGKIEADEGPVAALQREIREELAAEITVTDLLCMVEYDYPTFHLSMQCFLCSLVTATPTLLEHEDARWLSADELLSVRWLPADRQIIDVLCRL